MDPQPFTVPPTIPPPCPHQMRPLDDLDLGGYRAALQTIRCLRDQVSQLTSRLDQETQTRRQLISGLQTCIREQNRRLAQLEATLAGQATTIADLQPARSQQTCARPIAAGCTPDPLNRSTQPVAITAAAEPSVGGNTYYHHTVEETT